MADVVLSPTTDLPVDRRPAEDWSAPRTGEAAVNLLRLAALILLAGFCLLKCSLLPDAVGRLLPSRQALILLTLAWGLLVALVHLCLSRGWVPSWLKYVVVALDTLFVTALVASVSEPQGPLLVLYFLVLASTPLRRSAWLVGAATGGAILAYGCLLGYYIYADVGAAEYYSNPGVKVTRAMQMFMVAGLLAAGYLAGMAARSPEHPSALERLAQTARRWMGPGLVALGVLVAASALAALLPLPTAERGVFAPGARLKVEAIGGGGEGPAWHPELGVLTSCPEGTCQLDRAGRRHVYRPINTCGLLFDAQGRLLACETRRLTRIDPDGRTVVLTDNYHGMRYNNPNDLTVDGKGRIYFSDPRYGDRSDMELRDEQGRMVEGVYRVDPDGTVTRILTHELERPNGVLVSADDRFLYVADANVDVGGARKLWRFPLRADGTVDIQERKLIYDWGRGRGADGLKQDQEGRLYVAAGRTLPTPAEPDRHRKGGIYVFSPEGQLLDFFPVPHDLVTNLAFGGDDLKTLYITAGETLYSVRTRTPGRVVWPPVR
jgi:gluconolactonase